MRRVLQLAGIAALVVVTACNYTEGSCWIDGQDSGSVGAGGGPIGPGWGGFGEAPPEPQDESNAVDCDQQGKWSELPECDLQYEQDTAYCNRFHKKTDAAQCRAIQADRLAYCVKTDGQTGHPPRWKGGKDD